MKKTLVLTSCLLASQAAMAFDAFDIQLTYGSTEIAGNFSTDLSSFHDDLQDQYGSNSEPTSQSIQSPFDSLPGTFGIEASIPFKGFEFALGGKLHTGGNIQSEGSLSDSDFRSTLEGDYTSWDVYGYAGKDLVTVWNATLAVKAGATYNSFTATMEGKAFDGDTLLGTDIYKLDSSAVAGVTGLNLSAEVGLVEIGAGFDLIFGSEQMNHLYLFLAY